ncbi:MAG TPA: glycosyltransferase family 9 protein, partial [Elusimicrobiales bacterium]|nr:glycosyltransferase family 9 protein [Elusimicrobiales bacterium]
RPTLELTAELRGKQFDAAVLFFVERKAMLPVFWAGIPLRIGPGSKIWSALLNKIIFQCRSKNPGHEADFNIALLEPLGVKPQKAPCGIFLTEQEKQKAAHWLEERHGIKPQDKLAILHPGSRGSAKNWPPKRYAELAALLADAKPDLKILLTGSPQELPLLQEVRAASGKDLKLLRDKLSLRELIGVISRSAVLAANSTGPLHLAVALGVPTVSFFPPIKGCLPQRWGPYGAGHSVLQPELPVCAKCSEKCTHFNCMETITAAKAFEAIRTEAPELFR